MPGKSGHMAFPGFDAARRAVIDIGSNSVRLVVYDGPPRAPIPICNEKALCGLGRDMTAEGGLNDAAVREALSTLTRFRHVLDDLGDPPVHVIATAAVREATNGGDFVEAVRALGFDVDVVTGAEEGELAAFGVLSVEPDARGIVGDMGGGSLELAEIDRDGAGKRISLPIGPLSLMRHAGANIFEAQTRIEKELDKVPFLKTGQRETLYSVGGAWRSIARIHMVVKNYPLSVLHHYELTAAQAIEVCELVARQSRRSLEEIPGITKRRIDTLPLASLALKMLLLKMDARKVVVSAGGLREGLIYRQLSPEARAEDPYYAACRFYAARLSPDPGLGPAAFNVLEPFFGDDASRVRQRFGVCLLADIGAYFHPDLRGLHAFDTALRAPFPGVSHEERVWAALALYHRHQGRAAGPKDDAMTLLAPDARQKAMQYGVALRFVCALAPKAPRALAGCSLLRDGQGAVFRAPADREALFGDTPRRRLDSLASVLGCPIRVAYDA